MSGDGLKTALAGALGPALLGALVSTLRVEVSGEENVAAARAAGPGRVLFAMWHSHQLLAAYCHRGRGIRVLISQHRDGELIARVVHRLGYGTVRGSTTRGGREAFFRMVREASAGHDLGITPDGPRGPREVVQEGVVRLAQWSGLPVVPLAAAGPRDWRLGSWDGFRIPRPWSRVRVIYAPHVFVARGLDSAGLETARCAIAAGIASAAARAAALS